MEKKLTKKESEFDKGIVGCLCSSWTKGHRLLQASTILSILNHKILFLTTEDTEPEKYC